VRLFYGLRFRSDSLDAVEAVQNALLRQGMTGRVTRRENLHMTLAFLGEIAPDRVPVLRELLRRHLAGAGDWDLSCRALGLFPGRILYLAPEAPESLLEAQASLAGALRREGFSLEDRPFRPHVTLCRNCRLTDGIPEMKPLTLAVSEAALMLSHRPDGVLTYSPLCAVT